MAAKPSGWRGIFGGGGASSRFTSQHVFITGGSEGLGLELARQLLVKGASVSIVSRTQAKLDAAARDLRASAQQAGVETPAVFAKACDVGSDAQVCGSVHGRQDTFCCLQTRLWWPATSRGV